MGCYTAGDGATHHAGCECHEAAHAAEVAELVAAAEDVVAKLTPKDAGGIAHDGFMALLKLSRLLRERAERATTSAPPPAGGKEEP